MAGFLDKNTRIIDMVLTGYGKGLLSKGDLKFVYWIPFDDEVDYDPYISMSASMESAELSSSINAQIEEALVREATTGYKFLNFSGSDTSNVNRPVYTMAQGQKIVPRIEHKRDNGYDIGASQRKVSETFVKRDKDGMIVEREGPFDRGYERFEATAADIDLSYTADSFPSDFMQEGFFVRVFSSGSDGLVEVRHKRDSNNEVAFSNDLRLSKTK
jgi:hypothetical protein